tara:strand:+ start:1050 stop:1379 length:330 start_codon:yes stop_codon:yes gene_type:complete
MREHKPVEEYYLHDHGDGNGWQVVSSGPGQFGLITTSQVSSHKGVVDVEIETYVHGLLSSCDVTHYMLTPEEARDLGTTLLQVSDDAEGTAWTDRTARENKKQLELQFK